MAFNLTKRQQSGNGPHKNSKSSPKGWKLLCCNEYRLTSSPLLLVKRAAWSVDGQEYLTCGHVEYEEDSDGNVLARKPKGGTLNITVTTGCDDNMKDLIAASGSKAVITHEGFDKFISSMECFDEEATKAEKEGTPLYVVRPD